MNALRGKAGMDDATIVGLRERVYPSRPPYTVRFMNNFHDVGAPASHENGRSVANNKFTNPFSN